MKDEFRVVTDVSEIERLNKRLARRLRQRFRFRETREITYPAGHDTGTVYFEARSGDAVRAWSPKVESDKLVNFILTGKPRDTKWMEISVQLNFPASKYNRQIAGAFVADANGDIFIAHRGKLTKGRAGLKKAKVFREFAAQTIEAEDRGQSSTLILICSLKDAAITDRLWDFAQEAREIATRLGEEAHQTGSDIRSPSARSKGSRAGASGESSANDRVLKLRAYFDEHAGEGTAKGHGGGKRTVEHGDIVKALEARLRENGNSQKAQAIDLAIVTKGHADLFEVKTSARTTDVYTAVGQLLIHGECIHELLGLPVRRYLVVPGKPRESHSRHMSRKAGIKVVVYTKDGSTYRFVGLASGSAAFG